MTLPTALAALVERRRVFWGALCSLCTQLPRGAIHGLLGGSDGIDRGQSSPAVMPELSWMTLAWWGNLLVQEALLTVLRELSYFSWFTPITNMGHQQMGQRVRKDEPLGCTPQVSPSLLQGSEDSGRLHNLFGPKFTPHDALDPGR